MEHFSRTLQRLTCAIIGERFRLENERGMEGGMKRRNHSWDGPTRPDQTTTFRSCKNCGLVWVSRHEPENDPPHWTEFERDGKRFPVGTKTPDCR